MKSKTLVSILQDLKNSGISRNRFSKICGLSDETLALIISREKRTPMPDTLKKISMGLEKIGYLNGRDWTEMYHAFMKEYGYLDVRDVEPLKGNLSQIEEILKGIKDKEGFLYKVRVLAELEHAMEKRKKAKSNQI